MALDLPWAFGIALRPKSIFNRNGVGLVRDNRCRLCLATTQQRDFHSLSGEMKLFFFLQNDLAFLNFEFVLTGLTRYCFLDSVCRFAKV